MYKAFLFDVDGVLIRLPEYFSRILERKGFVNAVDIIDSFYRDEDAQKCLIGQMDELIAIKPYLEKINWQDTPEAYFSEQYEYEKQFLDHEILNLITAMRKKGIKAYLATDQNKGRGKYLLDDIGFRKSFDGWFISSFISYRKVHEGFWINLLGYFEINGLGKSELLFIDDRKENIDMAKKYGIDVFYVNTEQRVEKLKKMLKSYS
jgi:putative hydrolase of the HAD superfamily